MSLCDSSLNTESGSSSREDIYKYFEETDYDIGMQQENEQTASGNADEDPYSTCGFNPWHIEELIKLKEALDVKMIEEPEVTTKAETLDTAYLDHIGDHLFDYLSPPPPPGSSKSSERNKQPHWLRLPNKDDGRTPVSQHGYYSIQHSFPRREIKNALLNGQLSVALEATDMKNSSFGHDSYYKPLDKSKTLNNASLTVALGKNLLETGVNENPNIDLQV
nr:hypothetical protein HmN_000363700 [Hymenolepis microstoma]